MMDNPRLVPHVRSGNTRAREGGKSVGNTRGGERAERKKGGREKECMREEREEQGEGGGGIQCACVPQYSTIPACAPLRSCRYAAHPRISSPLGSHVIERSPSRGETQPIHILCSPLYILRRERKREREKERVTEMWRKRAKGDSEGDKRDR